MRKAKFKKFNKFISIKEALTITFLIFTLSILLSSCSIPFFPEVPPSSYSTDAAINILSSKYNILDRGYINGFGDVYLGEGRYALIEGIDGLLFIFKYENNDEAKENWSKLTKRYGNPLKMKYLKVNMRDYGIFTIRLDNTDIYSWFKDNWLIVIVGDRIDRFVEDINKIYKTVKSN